MLGLQSVQHGQVNKKFELGKERSKNEKNDFFVLGQRPQ